MMICDTKKYGFLNLNLEWFRSVSMVLELCYLRWFRTVPDFVRNGFGPFLFVVFGVVYSINGGTYDISLNGYAYNPSGVGS